jgi:hypothetical protein
VAAFDPFQTLRSVCVRRTADLEERASLKMQQPAYQLHPPKILRAVTCHQGVSHSISATAIPAR